MPMRFRDALFTAALVAGVVFLYALQNSREHPSPRQSRPVVDVPVPPYKAPDRMLDRYRQFGLPSANDMILYFPTPPASLPVRFNKL